MKKNHSWVKAELITNVNDTKANKILDNTNCFDIEANLFVTGNIYFEAKRKCLLLTVRIWNLEAKESNLILNCEST